VISKDGGGGIALSTCSNHDKASRCGTGIWDLPKGPSGQGYAGLAIVDGRVIATPLEQAIRSGLNDVPLIVGSMG
jgi:hypothetical protein